MIGKLLYWVTGQMKKLAEQRGKSVWYLSLSAYKISGFPVTLSL